MLYHSILTYCRCHNMLTKVYVNTFNTDFWSLSHGWNIKVFSGKHMDVQYHLHNLAVKVVQI